MKKQFVEGLIELAEGDSNIILITADLGFGAFEKFEERFPNQYFNVGIAEQAMIGVASGMALLGKKVFVYSIGNFVSLRCLEQIRNDACYHNLNINIVCQGGGFTYGSAGMSHHATEDIGIIRVLPNISLFTPLNGDEAHAITKAVTLIDGVTYIRLENDNMCYQTPVRGNSYVPYLLKESGDILIASYGSIVSEVMASASDKLISVAVFPSLKPVDYELWVNFIRQYRYIVVVEEHQETGGLGSILSDLIVKSRLFIPLDIMAIKDAYTSVVGNQMYLRELNEIDEFSISNKIELLLNSSHLEDKKIVF